MIFSRQLEVGQCNRDTNCDAEQYDVNNEKNTVESVMFTTPESGKYVVKFNWNSTAMTKKMYKQKS